MKISFTVSLASKPLAFSTMRVKLQFHPQTKDNQKLAESETVKLKIDIIIERNSRNYRYRYRHRFRKICLS